MTESTASCEDYQLIEIIKNEKKVSKHLIPIILLIVSILIPVVKYINKQDKIKDAIERRNNFIEQQKRMIYFDGFAIPDEPNDFLTYHGLYYTQDSLCNKYRFKTNIHRHLSELPEKIEEDTILVRNYLFHVKMDSSLRMLHIVEGYSVKVHNYRIFDYLNGD